MQKTSLNPVLGILGGAGPLASSKFVETIYLLQTDNLIDEQLLPRIILYSDPSIPDRTQYLDLGLQDVLLRHLIDGLTKLLDFGSDKLVICCFTLHHLLPLLPKFILDHVISLPELALQRVTKVQKKTLILCTSATNRLKIFESARNWDEASDFVVFPDTHDQKAIHETIYRLKKNRGYLHAIEQIKALLDKYQTDFWCVGCTEFHLITHPLLLEYIQSQGDHENGNQVMKIENVISEFDKVLKGIDPLLMVAELINNNFLGKRYGREKRVGHFSK